MSGTRHFTVDEANRLIPFLRQELLRLKALVRSAQETYRELEVIKAVGADESGRLVMLADYKDARRRLRALGDEAGALVEGIHRRGCELKDVELGLVDFPALLDGREVLLCWRMDEDEVRHYHDPAAGYAGRKPLPPAPGSEPSRGG
ncbi:DUF2203 domain-containing protein [Limnochorda pilosa]|uniref:Cell division protein DivIVA n=1 Tax=Limnochorda pilosa TaxID=1555112 RepID=A0A0K2SIV5_LIMPI|nr:DUF2203 domain-containing protein [Limnochorda pilosa]BAS27020.1 hypothetical protein LIP_1163 [Limnochorda pilosa]